MSTPSENGAWFSAPMNYWYSALRPLLSLYAAPQSLNQSILPWTFAGMVVNEDNSRDPATEQAIVNTASYGRQLGRVSDALACVIDSLPEEAQKDKAIQAFLDLKKKIDEVKEESEAARFDKVLVDLKDLKQRNAGDFADRLARINALAGK
jgi:hypothetical protein